MVLCTYQRPESVGRFLDSIGAQTRLPDELLVVDASHDAETERVVANQTVVAGALAYWRVTGPGRGLTRQRNFAVSRVTTDLVAFFDDDIVLDHACLAELENAHHVSADVVCAGCFVEAFTPPTRLWRMRRTLKMIPDLRPGSYTPSGMSVPWQFHPPTDGLIEGDWLHGGAMMVKTQAASEVLWDEALTGYAQGEDLDFSLRLRQRGRLVLAGAAHCQHLKEPAGRPDAFKLGEMEIWNRYRIWRRAHRQPTGGTRWSFVYAWALDTVLLARDVVHPRRVSAGVRRIAGRLVGAYRIVTNHVAMGEPQP